jgi:hypothetical protein
MEQLTLVSQAANGTTTTLSLTDYTTYFVTSRRGMAAPPHQVFSERLPDTDGARFTGRVVRERKVSLALTVRAASYEAAWARVRADAAVIREAAYLQSTMNGATRQLDVVYAGGLEDADTGRWRGTWPVLALTFQALAPYWYDPTLQQRDVPLATGEGGLVFPFAFPFVLTTPGQSAAFTLPAGDAPSDWTCTVPGPFTRVQLLRGRDGSTLDLQTTAPAGSVAIFSTAVGQRRVLLDSFGAVQNVSRYVSRTSTYWRLDPGANALSVVLTGGNGLNTLSWRWQNSFLAPG